MIWQKVPLPLLLPLLLLQLSCPTTGYYGQYTQWSRPAYHGRPTYYLAPPPHTPTLPLFPPSPQQLPPQRFLPQWISPQRFLPQQLPQQRLPPNMWWHGTQSTSTMPTTPTSTTTTTTTTITTTTTTPLRTTSKSSLDSFDYEDLETDADLLEGDIALPEGKSRLAVDFGLFPAKRWKNQTVQYKISINHTMTEVLVIESAIRTISFVSCLKFVKWDGKEKDYIHFQPSKKRKGCWSFIGRKGGRQQLSLEQPKAGSCKCFCTPGRAMHEIMHSLGFYHEHARPDRDQYIQIVKTNVRKGKLTNFKTMKDLETSRNFNYDYSSIMHYGPYFFSKNKRGKVATIVPKEKGTAIGQREMLSTTDCMKINSLYKCFGSNAVNRQIQIICAMVGYTEV